MSTNKVQKLIVKCLWSLRDTFLNIDEFKDFGRLKGDLL